MTQAFGMSLNKSSKRPMPVIDPARFGVSFSIKQCRGFGISPVKTLDWLLQEAGFRRFRLMSYWDELERVRGKLDFKELDRQLAAISKVGGVVTLCLGARQPRWPENHWPAWAWQLSYADRSAALLDFLTAVVNHYKSQPGVISYQLENEALLKSFGRRPEVDRTRLRQQYNLLKQLDPTRPIIMSTSTSWGIPLRSPIPDMIGFSYYHSYYDGPAMQYKKAGGHYLLLHKLRAGVIKLLWNRSAFIHELQCEPWAPKAIWEVSSAEQDKSMGTAQISSSITLGRKTTLYPIDLWGGEWWYWRLSVTKDSSIWQTVQTAIQK